MQIIVRNLGRLIIDEDGHRRPLVPGYFEGQPPVWVNTDLTAEPAEVRAEAAKAWTPEVLAAWRAKCEAEQPSVVDIGAIDAAELNAALTAPGTVTRALGEIVFGIIKGTIEVPQPKLTKAQFFAMVKDRIR